MGSRLSNRTSIFSIAISYRYWLIDKSANIILFILCNLSTDKFRNMSNEKTLIELFYEKEKKHANEAFLRQPFGDMWEEYTWGKAGEMVRKLASAILSYDLPPHSNIGLVSKNCREWIIADLAIMMAGHVSVPFFATLTGEQIKEVLDLGDVKLLFVGKTEAWDDMKTGISDDLPIIKFPDYKGFATIDRGIAWNDIMQDYPPLEGYPTPTLDDTWTIVFTSGTTGTPKGVTISYRKLANVQQDTWEANNLQIAANGDNRFFSYLPLNHIAERIIVECSAIEKGGTISFAENLETFTQNLVDTEPTVFFAVPRIWTKFQLGVLQKIPPKKLVTLLKIPLVSGMIKRKIKRGLGLGKSRVNVSGAAPISQECKDWYERLGIMISEGYGMTENCAVCTFLPAHVRKPGSVGKATGGAEIKIDKETNEVLMKARFLMDGYYNDAAKTNETLKDGWLHTGDQGRVDDDGYLFLTGRIKDTFKTAKGEFIVPAPIEFKFTDNKDIEQICVVGIGLPQPLALVSLSDGAKAKQRQEVQGGLKATLETANNQLDNYTKVSTIIVLNEPFTVDNGMLTPTLKAKRNEINTKYSGLLEAWHDNKESVLFAS